MKIKKFFKPSNWAGKSQAGFTLIELLVVIGIIAVLATIGAVNFSGARAKARDGKRQADIVQIKAAFEMAAAGSTDGLYPTTVPADITNAAITPSGSAEDRYCWYVSSDKKTFAVSAFVEDDTTNGLKDKGYETDITVVLADYAGEIGTTGQGTACPTDAAGGTMNCDDANPAARVYCERSTTVL